MSSSRWPIASIWSGVETFGTRMASGAACAAAVEVVDVPGRVDAVDAHDHLARAEAAGLDRLHHLRARRRLAVGRDRILQVEDHPSAGRLRAFSMARAFDPGM